MSEQKHHYHPQITDVANVEGNFFNVKNVEKVTKLKSL